MPGPRDPENPNYTAPRTTPGTRPSTTRRGRGAETTGNVGGSGRTGLKYVDQLKYPGLERSGGFGISDYLSWVNNTRGYDPALGALFDQLGPTFQSFMWYAYTTNMDPTVVTNTVRARWGAQVGDIISGVRGNGSGRVGGGGGGGSAAPTAQDIEAAKASIRNAARTLGRPLSEDELTFYATKAATDRWTNDQLMDVLTEDQAKLTEPGTFSTSIEQIKGWAAAQLMPISDDTAREWSLRIQSGEMDPATVQSIFQQRAMVEYGWAASGLQNGMTMRDILMPARDRIAAELELNANEIDFAQPRWRDMAQVTDEKGQTRAATLTEVTKKARQDSAFKETNTAQQATSAAFMQLRSVFEGSG